MPAVDRPWRRVVARRTASRDGQYVYHELECGHVRFGLADTHPPRLKCMECPLTSDQKLAAVLAREILGNARPR